jgi:hypothetical protein
MIFNHTFWDIRTRNVFGDGMTEKIKKTHSREIMLFIFQNADLDVELLHSLPYKITTLLATC